MNFKYRWKNGAPPSRDEAARSEQLLDEGQFDNKQDHMLAEDTARKYLNVPSRSADADRSVLPHGNAADQADMNQV